MTMYKLGERNYALIQQGLKVTGSFDPAECLPIIEEQLYVHEMPIIRKFLSWVNEDVSNRKFGSGTYEQRFTQFNEEVCGIKILGTVDCTPTWEGLLPLMIAQIEENTKHSDDIKLELKRMAQAADKWNEYCKETNNHS